MIKTEARLLEEMYDSVHLHKLQMEMAADSLRSRLITLIDPKAKEIVNKLRSQLARIVRTIQDDKRMMDRIVEKIGTVKTDKPKMKN